jgi:hypothetical protein
MIQLTSQREGAERRRDRIAMENFYYSAIYQVLQAPVNHLQKATALKRLKAKNNTATQYPTARNPIRQWRPRQDSRRGTVHTSFHKRNQATKTHGMQVESGLQSALHLHTVQLLTESDDTRGCGNTICPPENEQGAARNMLRVVV